MAANTLYAGGLVYNNTNTVKATAVTVTADYKTTALKSSGYSSSVVTIVAARTKAINIEGNDKANKIVGTGANDTINGGAGNDTLTGGSGKDIFIYDGKGADLITDYTAGEDTLKISSGSISSYSYSGSDVVLKVGSGTVKVRNARTSAITVVNSSNKISTYTGGLIYNGTAAKATAVTVSSIYGNTLAADNYSSTVITIDAAARTKALNIVGNAKSNRITGTSANDTINGGAGNDTLTGGAGNDIFIYEGNSGNDVITDYTAGKDTIKVVSASVSAYSLSGSDAVLKIGSNTLKVNNVKNDIVLLVDENKKATAYQSGVIYNNAKPAKANAVTLTASSANSLTAGSAVVSVDASTRVSAIKIVGNTKSNVLKGGSGKDFLDGGKGNDTIIGGKGSDTLTGGEGMDVFIYSSGDGSDLITDYKAGEDILRIKSGEVKGYTTKNGDAILKTGSGAITVKGAADALVKVLDEDDVPTVYKGGLIYNNQQISKATAVTVSADYDSEFHSYGASVESIDASARSKVIEITGNASDNYIRGGTGKDTIYGGAGNDTLIGGKGSDVLNGGSGADVFYFSGSDGNDTVTDYGEGDIISVGTATISLSTVEGGAVLKIGSGKVTVQNEEELAVTVVGADSIASIYTGEEVATETWGSEVIVTYGGESISGTEEDDTLIGTEGNDTFTGYAGDDVFVYEGSGDFDIISDYGTGDDTISIGANSVSGGMVIGEDVFLAIGSGILKLLGAKDKPVIIDASGRELEYDNGVYLGERIKLTAGNDTYSNGESQKIIYGLAGADEITNEQDALSVTIAGGEGRDTIRNYSAGGNIYRLDRNDGANTIVGYNENDTIVVAAESYSTGRSGDNFLVIAGADSFVLRHAAQFPITVKESSGGLKTYNSEGTRVITGDTLNTEIVNTNGSATILGVASTYNYINNYGLSVSIAGSTSVDYINNHGDSVSVSGGTDDDYIWNYGNAAVLDGGPGVDRISSYTDGATIHGGTGSDIIYLSSETTLGNVCQYASGDGNDIVYNFTANDTLEITGGSYSTVASGENVLVQVGKGTITLAGASSLSAINITGEIDTDTIPVTISLTAGDDTLGNTINNAIIYGLAGDDVIQNIGSGVTINAGAGDDSISLGGSNNFLQYASGDGNDVVYNFTANDTLKITGGSYSTIASGEDVLVQVGKGTITLAGASSLSAINITGEIDTDTIPVTISLTAGDDTLGNTIDNAIIYGLAGDDAIQNTGSGVTINAGAGDDSISLGGSNNFLQYASGDGNDVVYNFTANDTLKITGGSYSTVASGEDVVVEIGEGAVTLIGGSSLTAINISSETDTGTAVSLASAEITAVILSEFYSPAEGAQITFEDIVYTYVGGEWTYVSDGEETLTADTETATAILDVYYSPQEGDVCEVGEITYTYDGENWLYEVISGSSSFAPAEVPWFTEDDTNFTGSGLDLLIELSVASSAGDLSMRGGELDSLAPVVAYSADN